MASDKLLYPGSHSVVNLLGTKPEQLMHTKPRTDRALTPAPEAASFAPDKPHRRNGKIARMGNEDREILNLMLRDGATYPRIFKKFADRGHQLSPNNLSRWHAGGHQDWLEDQAYLDEMRLRFDFADRVLHETNGTTLDAASMRIAVTQMYTLLMSFDPVILKDKLAANPGAYSRILNSLCKLTEGSFRYQRRTPTTSPLPATARPAAPPRSRPVSR